MSVSGYVLWFTSMLRAYDGPRKALRYLGAGPPILHRSGSNVSPSLLPMGWANFDLTPYFFPARARRCRHSPKRSGPNSSLLPWGEPSSTYFSLLPGPCLPLLVLWCSLTNATTLITNGLVSTTRGEEANFEITSHFFGPGPRSALQTS